MRDGKIIPGMTFDQNRMTITDDDEGEVFPVKFEVCGMCNGSGSHVNRSIDGNGLSDESLGDEEFMDDYRSGAYDVTCEVCDGTRVFPVPSTEAI